MNEIYARKKVMLVIAKVNVQYVSWNAKPPQLCWLVW